MNQLKKNRIDFYFFGIFYQLNLLLATLNLTPKRCNSL